MKWEGEYLFPQIFDAREGAGGFEKVCNKEEHPQFPQAFSAGCVPGDGLKDLGVVDGVLLAGDAGSRHAMPHLGKAEVFFGGFEAGVITNEGFEFFLAEGFGVVVQQCGEGGAAGIETPSLGQRNGKPLDTHDVVESLGRKFIGELGANSSREGVGGLVYGVNLSE